MSKFKAGDKVRCVDPGTSGFLKKDAEYVVTSRPSDIPSGGVVLKGLVDRWFYDYRFVPADDTPAVEAPTNTQLDGTDPKLSIYFAGLSMAFDIKSPESRQYVDNFIDAVYNSLKEVK